MYDFDITNIKILSDFLEYNKIKKGVWFDLNEINSSGINDSLELTVEKCVANQMLLKKYNVGLGSVEEYYAQDHMVFKLTGSGCLLISNLKYLGIIEL